MVEPIEEPKLDSRHLANLLGVAIRELSFMHRERGHTRSGITKNHGQPRDKARSKMERKSRRINRGKR